MISRGRSEGTAEQYFWCVRQCLKHPGGLTGRLVGRKLAPKTKRINKAALRAWAKFNGDNKLLDQLEDMRLPPPERVTVKEPLSSDQWAALSAAVEEVDIDEVSRAILTMICERGFRVSDVLRLSQLQARRSVDTGVLLYRGKGQRQLECMVEPFQWCLDTFIDQGKYLPKWDHVWTLVSPRAKNPPRAARLKIQRYIKQVAEAAGLDPKEVYTHRLRRTIATEFYNETRDIVALQKYMGWADIKTASNYVDHAEREALEKIASKIRQRRNRRR
jgi:site-specific recombinase XerD